MRNLLKLEDIKDGATSLINSQKLERLPETSKIVETVFKNMSFYFEGYLRDTKFKTEDDCTEFLYQIVNGSLPMFDNDLSQLLVERYQYIDHSTHDLRVDIRYNIYKFILDNWLVDVIEKNEKIEV